MGWYIECFKCRSSRIRLTKAENETDKQQRKDGPGRLEYGSSWQPLLVSHVFFLSAHSLHLVNKWIQNELRASCETQKIQCEPRIPTKRRHSRPDSVADAISVQPSELVQTQQVANTALSEDRRQEESDSSVSKKSSKSQTTRKLQAEPNPAAAPSTTHGELLLRAQKATGHCRQQPAYQIKSEAAKAAAGCPPRGSEERNKRQKRGSDPESAINPPGQKLQESHEVQCDTTNASVPASSVDTSSVETEIGSTHSRRNSMTHNLGGITQQYLKSPYGSNSDQQQAGAPMLQCTYGIQKPTASTSSTQHQAQLRSTRKAGGAELCVGPQSDTRRYNTRSKGAIKEEAR